MSLTASDWKNLLGYPKNYDFEHSAELIEKYEKDDYIAEVYYQANGPKTKQKVIMLLPKDQSKPMPAVAVPFYYPEAMMAHDIKTGEHLPFYDGIEMMLHLVRRGYAVATAEVFHLTYLPYDCDKNDFSLWNKCATALLNDHPDWTGMGKLVHDTTLLIDLLANDPRVDESKMGIAGHSLGGKMAFYTGCLDDRIKAILTSDFGFGFEQSNWDDIWYWGKKLELLKEKGADHASLLSLKGGIPFCLLAGKYDDMQSFEYMKKADGYCDAPEKLKIVNHATGHRPTWDALCEGYDFLDKYIK